MNWVDQNYLRLETITRANAHLVNEQAKLPLAQPWDGGDRASTDGLRFRTPTRTVHPEPNPKYFGVGHGITGFSFTSGYGTRIHGIVVPGTLRLWNLDSGTGLLTLNPGCPVAGAMVLKDGRSALSWSDRLIETTHANDSTLRVWGLETGADSHTLVGHEDSVVGSRLLDNGRRALSWSEDNTLRIWDLITGAQLHRPAGHLNAVVGASILDDGRRALSWSSDRSVRLWDLASGSELARYFADATISVVLKWPNENAFFVGDAIGRIHLIRLTI